MRKFKLIFVCALLCYCTINAQEKDNYKVSIELTPSLGTEAFGLSLNIEPKYNLTDVSSVGLRFNGSILLGRNLENSNNPLYDASSESYNGYGLLGIVGTYDRYLGKPNSKFQPFVGGGIGFYQPSGQSNITLTSTENSNFYPDAKAKGQIGGLIRGGFESGKFRLGLEYNLIPRADLVVPNGDVVATVNDSYFGITLGFTIGGGKWTTPE